MPLARPVVLVTEVVITAGSHVDRDDSIDDLERSMEPNGDLSRPSTYILAHSKLGASNYTRQPLIYMICVWMGGLDMSHG